MTEEPIRLSKLMAQRGVCSRREADRYIEAGQVLVDGAVVDRLGTKVAPDAQIELKRTARNQQDAKVTILLNKPIGYVSTQPEKGYAPALDLITEERQVKEERSTAPRFQRKHLQRLSVVGRLDIDSKGLLVFTQDGTLARTIIGPESRLEKEYLVDVDADVSGDAIDRLSHGLALDGKALRPAKVSLMKPRLLKIILTEGKKRQIRRMCELVGLRVTRLKRVRVGGVRLGDLPEGRWRYLRPNETF